MKKFLPFLLAFGLLFSCSKENVESSDAVLNQSLETRGDGKVDICHINGQGQFQAISVSVNAVNGHLAHGDYLPDADGDGYTAIGACTGSMDDCDDNDPEVGPCCSITEELLENDVEIYAEASCIFGPGITGYALGGENSLIYIVGFEGQFAIFVATTIGGECVSEISEQTYNSYIALVETFIENNELINYCELGITSSAPQSLIKKSSNMIPQINSLHLSSKLQAKLLEAIKNIEKSDR